MHSSNRIRYLENEEEVLVNYLHARTPALHCETSEELVVPYIL